MTRTTLVLALVGTLAAVPTLGAQPPVPAPAPQPPAGQPGPGRMMAPRAGRGRRMVGGPGEPGVPGMPGMPAGMGPGPAAMLLAHTGELKLTDQQVVRLAAIARRSEERRETMRNTMRARMDSVRRLRDTTPTRRPPMPDPAMQADMQRMRDQSHADLRDAITVLTPDQQATAWEMVARGRRRP